MSDIPRRSNIQTWTDAERAIQAAVDAVEAMPPDVRLTDAVTLLYEARQSVADYVDGIQRRRRVAVERLEQAERLRQAAEAKRNAPTPQCQCPAYDAARERGGYPSGICPDCGQWYPGQLGPRGSSKPAEGSMP